MAVRRYHALEEDNDYFTDLNVLIASPSGRRLSTDLESARPSSVGEEELQLQLALAMSKEEHEEELKKQKSDDIKLQLAIEESQKDDDKVSRHRLRLLTG